MRVNRQRLDFAANAFHCDIELRFDDLDMLWHVNHAAAVGLLQESRVRFSAAYEFSRTPSCELVVAALHVEFAHEMLYPSLINASTVVLEVGQSSYRLGQVLRQVSNSCVYAEVILVCRHGSQATALPATYRAGLQELHNSHCFDAPQSPQ